MRGLEKDEQSYFQQKPAQRPFYQGLALIARRRQIASRQKQPDGQTSRVATSLLSRTSYFQWQFYQRQAQAQWPFDQGRDNGLPNLQISATKCNFAIIPHKQVISGRASFINARPNGRFIKAEATGWPDFQILAFRYYPAQSIYQRPGSGKAGPMAILSPNGRFMNGYAVCSKSLPNGCVINARPNGRFINARPNGRFIKTKTTDGQTCRFQPQIAISLLSRTINLSAAGLSYFQQKPAQWPFYQRQVQWPLYQRQAQWPFYQGRSNRMARPPDFSNQFISGRGQAIFKRKLAQWPFYQRKAQWPF